MPARTRRHPPARPGLAGPGSGPVRVATLTRISTDEVNQPYSLEAQATGLDAFVASQPGHVISHRFIDQASGATLDRPGLQQALAAARAGAFDVLLVYRIDRLTRSIVGLMSIVEELQAAGVALRSATEPIDTQGPVGRMLLQLLGIFAEFERGLLIDRITKGFARKAARGEWLTGPGPYGYTHDPTTKTLLPNPEEAAVVQAIFAAYIDEHLGATAIANQLNDTGRRSRSGQLWSNQAILRLLRNPTYLGKIRHDETIHDGKHEPILDEATFAAAQALLHERSGESTAAVPTTSEYLLTGLVRCLACRGAYVGVSAHGRNGFYRYYACRTRQAMGARACPGQRVPADDLEAAVIGDLLDTYDDLGLFDEAIAGAYQDHENERPRLDDELASTQTQLRDTTAAIDRYLRAFEAGTMPDTLCAPRVAELSARRDELAVHRDQLTAQLRAATPPAPSRSQLQAIGAAVRQAVSDGSPEPIKEILGALIDRVEISPDRHAQPYFRIPLPDDERPGPSLARANGTPVRMGSHHVVLGWHYTNTPSLRKDQVTASLDGRPVGLGAANAVLRVGDGDR